MISGDKKTKNHRRLGLALKQFGSGKRLSFLFKELRCPRKSRTSCFAEGPSQLFQNGKRWERDGYRVASRLLSWKRKWLLSSSQFRLVAVHSKSSCFPPGAVDKSRGDAWCISTQKGWNVRTSDQEMSVGTKLDPVPEKRIAKLGFFRWPLRPESNGSNGAYIYIHILQRPPIFSKNVVLYHNHMETLQQCIPRFQTNIFPFFMMFATQKEGYLLFMRSALLELVHCIPLYFCILCYIHILLHLMLQSGDISCFLF